MATHHPATLDGAMIFVSPMNLQDRVIKVSCGFMGCSSSR